MCFQVYLGSSHACTESHIRNARSTFWCLTTQPVHRHAVADAGTERVLSCIIWQRCSLTTFEETLLREVATLLESRQADVLAFVPTS